MIVHDSPSLTLHLDLAEVEQADALWRRIDDLGAEACGSPAHRQALEEWGEFCRRVAIGNAARGHNAAWEWAPTWRLRPELPSGGILPDLPDLVRMVWREVSARRRQEPAPKRAEVVPIRRDGGQ